MFDQFLSKAAELLAQGEPFAVAVVVRYEAPISGKPGDKAIILTNGEVWGWIGGGCAQPVVVKEALKAIETGEPQLIRISASPSTDTGVVEYTLTCHSGGTLEIYIEPVLPKPHIVILGRSPVGQILAKLSKAINFTVSVAAPTAHRESFPDVDSLQTDLNLSGMQIRPQTFIVIATQGEHDEEALEEALKTTASYVTFVASKVKAAKVFESLKQRGIPSEQVHRVRAPAGLNIRATTPEEIAVSILAEIVQRNKSKRAQNPPEAVSSARNQEVKDPVCGMTVDPSVARDKSEFQGHSFYFCCAGCKQKFEAQPETYSGAALTGSIPDPTVKTFFG
jgi:xanthine dehydrogenase accessory factor